MTDQRPNNNDLVEDRIKPLSAKLGRKVSVKPSGKRCKAVDCRNTGQYLMKVAHMPLIYSYCKKHRDQFLKKGFIEEIETEQSGHKIPLNVKFQAPFVTAEDMINKGGLPV